MTIDGIAEYPGHAPVAAFLNLTAGSRASLFEFANLARAWWREPQGDKLVVVRLEG